MTVGELKDVLDLESRRYNRVCINDGYLICDVDKVCIDDEYVVLEYENKPMYAYDFLNAFETIAVEYGLLLRMQLAPRRSRLLFYFIDMDTNQKSLMYAFYIKRMAPSRIIEDLKKYAKEFKERVEHK